MDLFAGRDEAEENTDTWWAENALAAIRVLAGSGREFQAYDIVEQFGVAEPDSGKRWGALLKRAAREGLIVPVGVARSRRPSSAGALCRTWRGVVP